MRKQISQIILVEDYNIRNLSEEEVIQQQAFPRSRSREHLIV